MTNFASNRRVAGAETLVKASATIGLAEFIERHGVSANRVMARAGLTQSVSDTPTQRIRMRDICNVLDVAASATGNDRFGLWFGHQFAPENFGLFGYLPVTSAHLGLALHNLERAFPVHQTNSDLKVSVARDICRVDYRLHDGTIVNRTQDAELSMGPFISIIRQALGPGWNPLEVQFEHPRPADTTAYVQALGCDVKFDQPQNSILLRTASLDAPMPKHDPILNAVLSQALADSRQHEPTEGLANLARNAILDLLKVGYPRLEVLAERLNMPPWTLQRRLSAEGKTFKDLVDEVRREIAAVLLSESALSVSEVAFRLGYAEISSFSRAFQRWHDVSPRDWRRHPSRR